MSNLMYEIYAPVLTLNPSSLISDVYSAIVLHYLHVNADYIIFVHLYEFILYLFKWDLAPFVQRSHVIRCMIHLLLQP
jgi:hypothetical protein